MQSAVQVNSETDFATKTEQFRSMVQSVAAAALASEEAGDALLHPCRTKQQQYSDAQARCTGEAGCDDVKQPRLALTASAATDCVLRSQALDA